MQGGEDTVGCEGGARGERGASDSDRCRKAHGGAMLLEKVRLATSEVLSAWLVIPQAGKVPLGASVGQDVREAQMLNSAFEFYTEHSSLDVSMQNLVPLTPALR